MPVIEVLLEVPAKIALGLASGQLVRVGGVIQDAKTKQIVAWLREGGKISKNSDPASALTRFLYQSLLEHANLAKAGDTAQQVKALSNLVSHIGVINNVLGAANVAATARSHYLLTLRLQQIQSMLVFSTRLGMLHLGMTGLGLVLMLKHFSDLQATLKKVIAEALDDSLRATLKINVGSALEAAQVVMEATDGNFKETMAAFLDYLLINGRQHILSDFHKVKHKKKTRGDMEASQKLLKQAMHLDETRIRAFLEVRQDEVAHRVANNRLKMYRKETEKYIGILLGRPHKRAVYLHKKVSDCDLQRYLSIEQWLRGKEDVLWDIVLEKRKQFWNSDIKGMLESAPGPLGIGGAGKAPTGHIDALKQAELAIENFQRFEGFALELKSISRLKISLNDWETLNNTKHTAFVNKSGVNLKEHEDYAILVDRDALGSLERLSES